VILLRSLVYDAIFYLLMLVMGILCAPLALWSREGAIWSIHRYTDIVLWLLPRICGLHVEVRGTVPTSEVVVGSKHQSFLDILIIANALPRPKFIMKKELRWAPILGFYAWRIGAVPVDRGKKGGAVTKMVSDIEDDREAASQLVIYPQGTRVAPGADMPYKVGAGVLYTRMGVPCVPAATNAGVFWGRKSKRRKPGLAVVEFLEPIDPGMEVQPFLRELEVRVEVSSDALMEEGGFRP